MSRCACMKTCGDVDEDDPRNPPGAVCKGLPDPPRCPLVEIVLVPRSEP